MEKLKNTLENKAKFFAQFIYQKVLITTSVKKLSIVYPDDCDKHSLLLPEDYLELTPLSQITDEDAIEVAKIIEPYFSFKSSETGFKKKVNRNNIFVEILTNGFRVYITYNFHIGATLFREDEKLYAHTYLKAFDYLRSKGYALPYMDLSVDDLISYGWVKLRDNA